MFTTNNSDNKIYSHGKLSILIDLLVSMLVIGFLASGLIITTIIFFPLKTDAATTTSQPEQAQVFSTGIQPFKRDRFIPWARDVGGVDNLSSSDVSENMDASDTYEPPVTGQGGTCIQGFIIDIYEQRRGGADWTITVKGINPDKPEITVPSNPTTGAFSITELSAGTYQVTLAFPQGWQPYTPAVFEVTLNGAGPECANVRFKMEALTNLVVTKLDNGGYMDFKTRIGIPGWEITVSNASGTELKQETDGEGHAYFPGLAPGTWTVTEINKTGWQWVESFLNGVPVASRAVIVNLVSPVVPGTFESVTFINKQVNNSFIKVVKKDIWGQPANGSLTGWEITITRPDGTQPPQFGTTADAGLWFTDLTLGDWTVCEIVQKPWWRASGPDCNTVTLTTPGEGKLVTFMNEPLGCVDGYKINHFEQGLGNWEIKAHNATTGEQFVTTTNASGYFQFFLPLGTWTLSETPQDGWTAVTPSTFAVNVSTLFTCEHVRFKNRTDYACVDVYKKDYYDNSGLPGWVINLQPAFGGTAVTGLTDGTGWTRFNELIPGTYKIWETSQPGWFPVTPELLTINLEATGACSVVTFVNSQTNQVVYTDPPPPPVPGETPACSQYYTVKKGDTLYGIGTRFGVIWQKLQEVNRLANPRVIYAGMVLCIP